MEQYHSGSGDNITRDKIIHNHLYGSLDYQKLLKEIEELKEVLLSISSENIKLRLKLSQKLFDLEQQHEKFKVDVFRLYETFTKIEIDNECLLTAKSYFDRGQFREADAILKADELSDTLDRLIEKDIQLEKETEKVNKDRQQIANGFLVKAQLQRTFYDDTNWFDKTVSYFNESLRAKRDEQTLFEYAHFLHLHNQFKIAYELYEEALEKYRKIIHSYPHDAMPNMARLLNNFGALLRMEDNMDYSEMCLFEAIEIQRKLTKLDPQTFTPDLADSFINLANLKKDNNKFELAEKYYTKALKIKKSLAKSNLKRFYLK